MGEQQSINESLDVIRKALEDDNSTNKGELSEKVLLLNQLIKNDGTIDIIDSHKLTKTDVLEILNKKLDKEFNTSFTKWLNKNIPDYLEKYFKDKKI